MVTLQETENDDTETGTDKCFACDDFGKSGELWCRCTGWEFGCMRSAAAGTSLMVACVTFAVRYANFLKLFISTQFSTGLFYCNWILYGSFVMPADIYRSGLVNIKHFLEAYNPLNNWRTSQKQADSLLCAITARSSALWSHRSNQRHERSKSRTLKCTNNETVIQTIECLTDCPTEDRYEQTARQRAFSTHWFQAVRFMQRDRTAAWN